MAILSRDDAFCKMKQLKVISKEERHWTEMRQWNEFQDNIEDEIISCDNLGNKLTEQEVIITELICELDKYKTNKDRHEQRIQYLKKIQ